MGIKFEAPDQTEANRRLDDVVDALTDRFHGREIYPKSIEGRTRRMAGHPEYVYFLGLPGRPSIRFPFDDNAPIAQMYLETAANIGMSDKDIELEVLKRKVEAFRAATATLVEIVDQGIESGWLPEHGQVALATENLKSL